MGPDTTAFWFGDFYSEWQNEYAQTEGSYTSETVGAHFSWQGRTIEPGEAQTFSFIVRSAPESTPPEISVAVASLPAEVAKDGHIDVGGVVSDADGDDTITVYAYPDGNPGRSIQVAIVLESNTNDTAFDGQLSIAAFNFNGGPHTLDFFAVDSTATLSQNSVHYSFTVNAPTPSPAQSPPATKVPTIEMLPTFTSDSYRLAGFWPGFGSVTDRWAYVTLEPWSFVLSMSVHVTAIGAAAIIAIDVRSLSTIPELFSLYVTWDVGITVGSVALAEGPPCFYSPDLTEFRFALGEVELNYFCRFYPLVSDVDSFWIGTYGGQYSNRYTQITTEDCSAGDSAAAFSWKDRVIAPGEQASFSVVARWGALSAPPTVSMTGTSLGTVVLGGGGSFTFTGTVADPDGDRNISVYVVVNQNVARMVLLAIELGGPSNSFTTPCPVSAFPLVLGQNTASFYAIDSTGTISEDDVIIHFAVLAPTPSIAATPPPSVTPPPSMTPISDWQMWVYWYPNSFSLIAFSQNGGLVDVSPFQVGAESDSPLTVNWDYVSWANTAFIGINVAGTSNSDQFFNLFIEAELDFNLGGSFTNIPCFHLPQNQGFTIGGASEIFRLNFYVRDHPLVTNVDSYWFGSAEDLEEGRYAQVAEESTPPGADTAVALSWQNQLLPAGGSRSYCIVARWGVTSSPPTLQIPADTVPATPTLDDEFLVTGAVEDIDGDTNIRVFVIPGGDYSAMIPFTTTPLSTTEESTFQILATPRNLGLNSGRQSLAFFAVDGTGAVSNLVNFTLTVLAPTPSATLSPSPSDTPAPTYTPIADMVMQGGAYDYDPGNHQLGIVGFSPSASAYTSLNAISILSQPRDGSEFSIASSFLCVGSVGILGIEATSHSDYDQYVNFYLRGAYLSYYDEAASWNFEDQTGFRLIFNAAYLNVLCKGYPLVTTARSYWFADWQDVYDEYLFTQQTAESFGPSWSTSMAVAWPGTLIPARGAAHISLVFRWGQPSSIPPTLNMSATSLPRTVAIDGELTFAGRVTGAPGTVVTVVGALDGNSARMFPLVGDLSPGTFSLPVIASSLGLSAGDHALEFYAIDDKGTIGALAATFSITVIAPTGTPTETPDPSRTPTKSALPSRTPRASASPRASPTAGPTPTESQTPRMTRTPRRSATPVQSPVATSTPTASPEPILISIAGNRTLPSIPLPVVLNGSGTIRPADGESIRLTDVVIPAGSVIAAENLVIMSSLNLRGDSALVAVAGSNISLPNNTVNFVLEAEGAHVPTLNLGNIGTDYSTVPLTFRVLRLSPEVERTTLVSGRTLSNCEEWRALTQLDLPGFTTECVTLSAVRLLEEESAPEIGLVLVPVKATDEKSDSGSVGVVVGVVIGVLVVVAAAGIGIFLALKKPAHDSSPAEGAGKTEIP